MPLGISRLVLSTSAIRRFFAVEDAVDADYLLTQSEDFLITERGELILGNQSDFVSGDFTDADVLRHPNTSWYKLDYTRR